MSTVIAPPNSNPVCRTCGHTTKSGGICVECKPTQEAVCLYCAFRGSIPVQPAPVTPPEPAGEPDTEIIAPTLIQISDDDLLGVVKSRRSAIVTPVDDGPLFEKISESANGIQIDGLARPGNATITIRAAGKTTREMAAMVAAMIRAVAAGQS